MANFVETEQVLGEGYRSKECRKMLFEHVRNLIQQIKPEIEQFGYSPIPPCSVRTASTTRTARTRCRARWPARS